MTIFVIWSQHWHHFNTDGIINSIIAFVSSWWSKWDATWLLPLPLLALVSASCGANSTVNTTIELIKSRQLKQYVIELFCHVMPLMLVPVSHDAKSVINSIIPFVWTRWSNEMQHDLVMWCHWHQHQHHVMPMASSIAPLHLLSQDKWNEVQNYFFVIWCI